MFLLATDFIVGFCSFYWVLVRCTGRCTYCYRCQWIRFVEYFHFIPNPLLHSGIQNVGWLWAGSVEVKSAKIKQLILKLWGAMAIDLFYLFLGGNIDRYMNASFMPISVYWNIYLKRWYLPILDVFVYNCHICYKMT